MADQSNPDPLMQAAIDEARIGLAEGGIPIGSVLVIDGRIVGRGHNRRVQRGSAILHAEMDALENAGRLKAERLPPGRPLLDALALRHVLGDGASCTASLGSSSARTGRSGGRRTTCGRAASRWRCATTPSASG